MDDVARELYHGGVYPIDLLMDHPVVQTSGHPMTPKFNQEAPRGAPHESPRVTPWRTMGHTYHGSYGFSSGFTMVQDGVPNPNNVDGASDLRNPSII